MTPATRLLLAQLPLARGTYVVLRVAGNRPARPAMEHVLSPPGIKAVQDAIGCSTLDTVILQRSPCIVMLVDDTGLVDGKPINPAATRLYHSVCRPGTTAPICGDVVIAYDGDF